MPAEAAGRIAGPFLSREGRQQETPAGTEAGDGMVEGSESSPTGHPSCTMQEGSLM